VPKKEPGDGFGEKRGVHEVKPTKVGEDCEAGREVEDAKG